MVSTLDRARGYQFRHPFGRDSNEAEMRHGGVDGIWELEVWVFQG